MDTKRIDSIRNTEAIIMASLSARGRANAATRVFRIKLESIITAVLALIDETENVPPPSMITHDMD